MSGFCDTIGLKSLIKYSTYHKNPENPSSIDLILTNNLRSFQNSCIIEKGLSDLHRMVLSIMKTSFERLKLVTNYRNYKLSKANATTEKNTYGFQEFIVKITMQFRNILETKLTKAKIVNKAMKLLFFTSQKIKADIL